MVEMTENGTAALSPAERRILELVADGLTNRQIARQLWVAETTIKFHLSRVYRKLGVANRTAAAMQLQRETESFPARRGLRARPHAGFGPTASATQYVSADAIRRHT